MTKNTNLSANFKLKECIKKFNLGERKDSLLEIKKLQGERPDFIPLFEAELLFYYKSNDLCTCKKKLHDFFNVFGPTCKYYMLLGAIDKDEGRLELAVLNLKQALEIESTEKDARKLLGDCYFELKKFDQALE